MIDELIEKWQNTHSRLLNDYSVFHKLSETEKLFLRSEMQKVVEFINDLKELKNTFK